MDNTKNKDSMHKVCSHTYTSCTETARVKYEGELDSNSFRK